ncbi:unnamed protein product [Moneuplotes crassus]|uniref:Uncharacterized protein n=1 Tax=Euplotes crassus TaxID=5936 RepID=A0AAD2D918_EUPCR|nr:unnamed protein product [Moneuplotes crassus]
MELGRKRKLKSVKTVGKFCRIIGKILKVSHIPIRLLTPLISPTKCFLVLRECRKADSIRKDYNSAIYWKVLLYYQNFGCRLFSTIALLFVAKLVDQMITLPRFIKKSPQSFLVAQMIRIYKSRCFLLSKVLSPKFRHHDT